METKVTDPGVNDCHLYGEGSPDVRLGYGEGEDGALARLQAHHLWSRSVPCASDHEVKTTLITH
jgi:hypothetical protein